MTRHSNIVNFHKLAQEGGPLDGFRDPGHLLGWLHGSDAPPDEKNDVLRDLLRRAVFDAGDGTVATEIMILALWPGLTAIRSRLLRFARDDVIDADLVGRLAIAIRNADPGGVRRVAATLLRNVERDIRRDWSDDSGRTRSAVDLDVVPDLISDDEVSADVVIDAMIASHGKDGALLAAVHLAGYSQKEVADHLGVSHDAIRKRCQRALVRLKRMSE
ncbi:sigma factor-like helix-turn-helix DNA-binding protein [Pelagovum pacificum]|uniref:Sigma-70 family RNA polymerase sigma factor n=1 Tax=Pelagovum pacificum TaxID=2588711 RepID=A0A5C5G8R2_9RHOB|nr:sigma factor-like helix-turn-helix DNA-binding protein [Pelagovum pacificum]QQA42007.1 sigma-70 family RNA polymerase sigma factor [Pelagovum pacificum]TNY31098.1 sigma-70 family RNA polymerase sigma factor [Pelagovum pacificum]